MAAGSLSLGGNLSIALGPLGRNGEASGSVNTKGKVAAMLVLSVAKPFLLLDNFHRYSYSKTRGLFGGVSLEGSVIMERQDANNNAYKSPVTVKLLLSGMVDSPPWAASLIRTLDSCTGIPRYSKWVDDAPRPTFSDDDYAFGGSDSVGNANTSKSRSYLKKKKPEQDAFPPASWGRRTDTGSYFSDDVLDQDLGFETNFEPSSRTDRGSSSEPHLYNNSRHNRSFSASPFTSSHTRSSTLPTSLNPFSSNDHSVESLFGARSYRTSEVGPIPDEGIPRAIALYTFQAVEVRIRIYLLRRRSNEIHSPEIYRSLKARSSPLPR
jgi:hypothetical protein